MMIDERSTVGIHGFEPRRFVGVAEWVRKNIAPIVKRNYNVYRSLLPSNIKQKESIAPLLEND